MPRGRIYNFHHARFSVAQAAIRENVVQLPGAHAAATAAGGVAAGHPIMDAAGAALERVYHAELAAARPAAEEYDAQLVLEEYDARRAAQRVANVAATQVQGLEHCLDLMVKYVLAWAVGAHGTMARIAKELSARDGPCDMAGALEILEQWLARYWNRRKPAYRQPAGGGPGAFPLPAASAGGPLRVGVLGDWGTGLPEAEAVLDQLMRQAPDVIIHVGDVYYAGTQAEQTAFLQMIQQARLACRLDIPVYTLPGNHDYYSGGEAFYATIPRLNEGVPNAAVQQHSFWCLRSDAWQLQGMDTGYHDSDLLDISKDITRLREDEAAWHQRQLEDAGGRRVILFSHHQLFSAFEKIGGQWRNPFLTQNLQAWESAGCRPAAWLWGHEHVLGVYETPGTLPVLGRCVGNSAIPVFADSRSYVPDPDGAPLQKATWSTDGKIRFPHGFVQTEADEGMWRSGFALLQLAADGTGTESYWQVTFEGQVSTATSQCLWEAALPAAG